MQNLVIVS